MRPLRYDEKMHSRSIYIFACSRAPLIISLIIISFALTSIRQKRGMMRHAKGHVLE